MPASSASITDRLRGSAAHSCSASEPKTTSRDRAGQLLGLRQVADRDVPGPGGPAGVQVRCPGQRPQQRGLAGAVAAHDADPLARPRRPATRRSSSTRSRYALAASSRLTRFTGACQPSPTARRRVRGPDHAPRARQTPGPVSATASSRAWRGVLGQERAGRAGSGHDRAERAVLAPLGQRAPQLGRSDSAAGCRSLESSGPTSAGSPDRSAAISGRLSSGSATGSGRSPAAARAARSRSQVA